MEKIQQKIFVNYFFVLVSNRRIVVFSVLQKTGIFISANIGNSLCASEDLDQDWKENEIL